MRLLRQACASILSLCALASLAPKGTAQCAGDAFEPNNSCEQATSLGAGLYQGLTLPAFEADAYRITVPAGQRLEVRVPALSASSFIDCLVRLHKDDGSMPPCAPGSTSFLGATFLNGPASGVVLSWPSPKNAAASFFVDLHELSANCSTYDLELAIVPDVCATLVDDPLEDNDACSQAPLLGLGTLAGLNVSIADPDFHTVVVSPGELVSLKVSGLGADDGAYFFAWDQTKPCGAEEDFTTFAPLFGSAPGALQLYNSQAVAKTFVVNLRPVPNQDTQTGFCFFYNLEVTAQFDACGVFFGDTFEPNGDCNAAPLLSASQTNLSIFAFEQEQDWYAIDVPARSTLRLLAVSQVPTAKQLMSLLAGCGPWNQEWLASSNNVYFGSDPRQYLQWSNTSNAAKNTRLFAHPPQGGLDHFCNVFDLEFETTLGTPFCNAIPNSSGEATRMSAQGSTVVGQGTLQLSATEVPAGVFGLVALSLDGSGSLAFGDGVLCLKSPILRLPVAASSQGTLQTAVDWTGVAAAIQPGQTWFFQTWYRDPAAGLSGFGVSEGLRLEFQ